MAITVTCRCGKTYKVLDSYAGKSYLCPACHTNTIVPGPANQANPEVAAPTQAPSPPRTPTQTAPPTPRGTPPTRPEPRVTANPPRPTAARKGASPGLIAAGGFGACVIVVGAAIILWNPRPVPPPPSPGPEDPKNPSTNVKSVVKDTTKVPTPQGGDDKIGKGKDSPRPKNEDLTTVEIVEKYGPSVARIKGGLGSGSGFVVLPNVVATNAHVVELLLPKTIESYFPSASGNDRGPSPAEVVYLDEKHDLAFLSVRTSLPPLVLAEDFQFRGGMEVTIIGSPGLGGGEALENAVNSGKLSTKKIIDGQTFFQLGASVNPGNSGGPVFDPKGRVIGVATLRVGDKEGLAFCVSIDDVIADFNRVKSQSRQDAETAASLHRQRVVSRLLTKLNMVYVRGLVKYVMLMEVAAKQNVPLEAGVNTAAQIVDPKLNRLENVLVPELKTEMSQATGDNAVNPQIRQHLVDLWGTYSELKKLIDRPIANLPVFKAKIREINDNRRQHGDALQLLLGISDNLDDPAPFLTNKDEW